jgi:hypothetical protein
MTDHRRSDAARERLPLRDLGLDLQRLAPGRRLLALASPFLWCGGYFAFARLGLWSEKGDASRTFLGKRVRKSDHVSISRPSQYSVSWAS